MVGRLNHLVSNIDVALLCESLPCTHIQRIGRCGGLAMDLPHSLADDLDVLTEALGDPVLDLEAVLTVLTDDLTAAVPSFLGLSMTLQVDEKPFTLNSFTGPFGEEARASLWLPLVPRGAPRPSGDVIFYGWANDAFSDLADDARSMFAFDGHAVMDRHLPRITAAGQVGIRGLREFSDINQAIGVLISMGHTAWEAQIELHRRALRTHRTVLETACDLLTICTAGPGATC